MSVRRRLPTSASRAIALAFAVLGCVALAFAFGRGRAYDRWTEDERDYLFAAANLVRSGTLSFAPPGSGRPAPNAYREPLFPVLIAASWKGLGLTPPASVEQVEALFARPSLYRAIRGLQLLFLAAAAAASAWSAWWLGGLRAGAAAFLCVAASPALQESGVLVMTEVLAAAWLALLAAALVAAASGRVSGAVATTALVGLLPLVRAEAVLLLPLSSLAWWWAVEDAPSDGRWARRRRPVTAAVALLLAALPALGWMARNQERLGMLWLSDRSGLALAVRANLDEEIVRVGAVSALLAWTPLDAAQTKSRQLAPSSSLTIYRWTGSGNFFSRTLLAWRRERAAPGANPLAVDAQFRREALQRFLSHPGDHLLATMPVAWRGIFAERSPSQLQPFDLRLALGLVQLAAVGLFAALAAVRRETPRLAFLLPFAVLFAFHALATEFLPRYGVPLLPGAWVAVAVLIFGDRACESVRGAG
jgi:4-amino-4-deoxy-L-arabinose transferase-like glycosyltransferase